MSLIINWFQDINLEKEDKTINGLFDVKSELQLITIDDEHFSL